MSTGHINQESLVRQRMAEEEKVQEKTDRNGDRWMKVYFGSGTHFRSWLSQFIELKGKKNVKVEGIDSRGFVCYEGSGEKMYRIWVRESMGHLDELR